MTQNFFKKHFFKVTLFLILSLAISFRYWLISDNKIYFWYDQARDANVSQQIIKEHDLKIQGPSASGTNDTIYHGVLYYYLLAPLYAIFNGNPFLVTVVFAVFNSFSVVLVYFLVKEIWRNRKLALLSAFLVAVNFEHAEYSTWLSNPMISLIPILVFFFSIWKIFYQPAKKNILWWLFLAGLSLGVIEQSAFYSVYFFGVIIVSLIYQLTLKKPKVKFSFTLKQSLVFFITYLFAISSMILTQVKLFLLGIFTLTGLKTAVKQTTNLTDLKTVGSLFIYYGSKIIETLTPTKTILSLIIFVLILFFFFAKLKKSEKWFLASWLLAPLWLFIIQFRNSPHMLIGLEYPIIFLFAYFIKESYQYRLFKWVGFFLLIFYCCCQFQAVSTIRQQETSIFTYQKGVMLKNELKLLDRTYELSNNNPFSISVWGSPYEYYITWAYLYDWYGKNKYGYVPSYFGSSQEGKFGSGLLEQKNTVERIHFLIEEPQINLVGDIYQQFIQKQNFASITVPTDKSGEDGFEELGEYKLQMRRKMELF